MSNFDTRMEKLARLAVCKGVHLQPGQLLVVFAPVEAADLARAVTRAGYDAGASRVLVRYSDEVVAHETWKRGSEEEVTVPKNWQAAFYNETALDNAAYLHIIGEDPDLMSDVDPKRLAAWNVNSHKAFDIYRQRLDNLQNPWSIIAWPTKSWAAKVYPELEPDQAVEALKEDILAFSRVDDNDVIQNWDAHEASFQKRVQILNDLDLESLHYTNSLGTDLHVGMPEGYIFMGGSGLLENGLSTVPNIPTEEVFSAPHCKKVNGMLYATLPLIHNGSRIEDFWFRFEDGKVVDYGAARGKEVLESILNTDEGAKYLGEVALVPKDTPIAASGKILYNTLFDENASCHFALGMSYTDTIQNGLQMSREERLAAGMNDSATHVDFMVGSDDLRITGKTRDGREVVIFDQGKFSSLFD